MTVEVPLLKVTLPRVCSVVLPATLLPLKVKVPPLNASVVVVIRRVLRALMTGVAEGIWAVLLLSRVRPPPWLRVTAEVPLVTRVPVPVRSRVPPLTTMVRFWATEVGPVSTRLPLALGLIVVVSDTSGTPDSVSVTAAAVLKTPVKVTWCWWAAASGRPAGPPGRPARY